MSADCKEKWYVLRDLRRRSSNTPGYIELRDKGFEVFTPLKWEITVRSGRRVRRQVPVISDLLFVRSVKDRLDAAVAPIPTLQYRYRRGQTIHDPMTVRDADMERFINAVNLSDSVRYYSLDEITPEMYGKEICVVGGPFDGYAGRLLFMRGSRKKRLLVEIPDFIAAAVEVQPEFIRYIECGGQSEGC